MVIWLIGLSASGKTSIGRALYKKIKPVLPNLVFLDGDDVRQMMGNDLGHTLEDRRKNAERICRLCEYFSKQEIHVICSILSIFSESREWNRVHLPQYLEVYIKADIETLIQREVKGIYKQYLQGSITGVAGMDIPFTEPQNPDIVIDNNAYLDSVDVHIQRILGVLVDKKYINSNTLNKLKLV